MANRPLMPILRPIGTPLSPAKSTPTTYTKIISYGKGYLILEASDGKKYKRSGGTLAWRNLNPGNLKFGDFAKSKGAIGSGTGGHAVFPTLESGQAAQKALLFSVDRGYNKLSIQEAIAKYAPVSDGNKPRQYARYIAGQLNVSLDTKLRELSESKKNKMIEAMKSYEGYETGKVTEV
jgi:hypothetical protein